MAYLFQSSREMYHGWLWFPLTSKHLDVGLCSLSKREQYFFSRPVVLNTSHRDFPSKESNVAIKLTKPMKAFFRNSHFFSITCHIVNICLIVKWSGMNPACLILRFLQSILEYLSRRVIANSLVGTKSNAIPPWLEHWLLDPFCFHSGIIISTR